MSYSSMRIEIEELRERNSQLERDLEAERHHRHAVERSEDALAVYVHTLLEERDEYKRAAEHYVPLANGLATYTGQLRHHLRQAHRFIESTSAFGNIATSGILQAGEDKSTRWDIGRSKTALAETPQTCYDAVDAIKALGRAINHKEGGE